MNDSSSGKVLAFPGTRAAPLTERTDEELMLLAGADSAEAFELLVRRYLPRLGRYCGKFLQNPMEGDEVAQEALIRIWDGRKRYSERAAFATYAFTVARNLCRNRHRDHGRRDRLRESDENGEAMSQLQSASPDVVQTMLDEERAKQVRAALHHLPEKLREAVLLRFDQDLDYAEIARIVESSDVTVRSRVFHALKKLRSMLQGDAS